MGRRKKQPEYPEIELKNENTVKLIYSSDKSLWAIAEENNITIEELQALIDEYQDSFDLLLEQDKQKRKDAKKLFQEIEDGLKKLKDSIPITIGEEPKKNYCAVNIGGKWDYSTPTKPRGSTSTVKVMNIDEEAE